MPAEYDLFARATTAFRTTYRAHEALFASAPDQFRNLVLDQCGSDHRPLVELLLSLGPLVCARLADPEPSTPWHVRRAPVVHHIVATRYLQPEVARWVVDAWGAALQIAPERVDRPTVDRPELVTDPAPVRLEVVAGTRMPTTIGARKASSPTSPSSPGRPQPPSWAGGPGHLRIGARGAANPTGQTTHPASTPRWRTSGPPLNALMVAQARRVERIWLAVMACTLLGVFVAAAFGIANRKAAAIAEASVLPAVPAGSSPDAIARASVSPMAPLPAAVAVTPIAAASAAGRSAPTMAIAAPAPGEGAQLISAGLGGHYRVALRVRSVSGTPSCSQVADALAQGRTSIEVIAHTPGTLSFSIASRNVEGRLSPDGHFESGIRTGTTDGVRWSFRMTGQFTTAGLVGETQTTTEAIIRWRRTQSCLTMADLVAERLRP
ncbi:hypothetical protein [Gemmatimonas sp.]|uniref:hypothetical protein n=1 Tax=Gemmatimonas sp. TaxID=1962908 RepID=UPI003568E955